MHQEQDIVGNLYIGTGHTDHLSKILKIIHDFQVIHPHVKFHLTSGDKYTLLEQINQGLLDFGIFIREFDKTKYDGIPLNLTNQLGILVSSIIILHLKISLMLKILKMKPLLYPDKL